MSDVLFEKIAQDLHRQGFSVNTQAVPAQWCTGLRDEIQAIGLERFSNAGVGRQTDNTRNASIRTDRIHWIEGRTEVERQWLDFCGSLQSSLNRSLLLGLFSFESHFAHYQAGAFYKRHLDAFRGQANRVVSVVLYLNSDWKTEEGGQLLLYQNDTATQALTTVQPELGTLLVFLSEEFPHEVLAASRDRFSIAGWYRLNSSTTYRADPPA